MVLKDRNQTTAVADRAGVRVVHRYQSVVDGFAATMNEDQAKRLAADPAVASVVQDQKVRKTEVQPNPPSWGLDRIDQRDLPLNDSYSYPNKGAGVHVYVIDTGIRATHVDFGGRATFDHNAIDTDNTDCNGHGTHVAGTVGGTTVGVAKDVRLHAVKVLDCNGNGTVAGAIAGLDWVAANKVQPAVANLSLGSLPNDLFDSAVRRTISAGITVVVAAGNSARSACEQSPARVTEAITVGATREDDRRASFSNFGTCTDVFAPGEGIFSAWHTADDEGAVLDGTSMAAPHVAGVAALHLTATPAAAPNVVRDAIVNAATRDHVTDPGAGSPNLLLHSAVPTVSGPDRLVRGEQLTAGQSRTSLDGQYRLVLQVDGNLVLYTADRRALWHTNTWGSDVTRAVLQPDGNFVLYSAAGVARWHTNTWGSAADRLVVQNDDNVVLYGPAGEFYWHRKQ
ncbi:subtilisin family serine protease [Saccharothrix tamanrassetensis]|uniref:Subtilisin family serine protease n=1 Tax=Saccharothrix tamanrassetensis TaxID=1051531 RepID=A0A841CLZ5_9PSEU|nr:S8 family serine peptidase [Saccharothrix tamanrassetensis]MBB5958130.1 subtilisin family serine protease [Saccharothrix tamanrassetensis]